MLKYLKQSRCRSLLVLWENIYTNVDVNSKPMRSRSFWAHSLHYKCYNEPVKGEMISDGWTFPCPLVGRGRSSRCNQLNCGSLRERENTQTEGHRTGELGQRERDSFNAPLQSNKPPPATFQPFISPATVWAVPTLCANTHAKLKQCTPSMLSIIFHMAGRTDWWKPNQTSLPPPRGWS